MTLGNTPITEVLRLDADADFGHIAYPASGERIPDGTTVTIYLYGDSDTEIASWPAKVTPESARWRITKETVASVLGTAVKFRIISVLPDGFQAVWYMGRVRAQSTPTNS
ncbi:LtfC-like domain-containing protein [Nocardia tengchongensis]